MVVGLLRRVVSPALPSALEKRENNRKHDRRESLTYTHMNSLEVLSRRVFLQTLLTFSGVENTIGLGVAHVAALGLAVVLKGAGLTKIVPAPERCLTGQYTATGNK